MSRALRCDGCGRDINWKEGAKSAFGDPPPITVRGRGLVLDFCSIKCMAVWSAAEWAHDDKKESPSGSKKTS